MDDVKNSFLIFKTNLNLKTELEFKEYLKRECLNNGFFLTKEQADDMIEFLKILPLIGLYKEMDMQDSHKDELNFHQLEYFIWEDSQILKPRLESRMVIYISILLKELLQ